jgi:hypothetical protein
MSNSNPLELAKKGHPQAIAYLINQQLKAKGITAEVVRKTSSLQILLESQGSSNQSTLVELISKGIRQLAIPGITEISIYGREIGEKIPSWSEKVILLKEENPFSNFEPESEKETTLSKVSPYPHNSQTSASRKPKNTEIDLLNLSENWKIWNTNQRTIMISAGVAIISMLLPWVDIGIASRNGLQQGTFLYLGFYIYPVWVVLKSQSTNKVWAMASSVLPALLSVTYIASKDLGDLEGLGLESANASGIGVILFLSSCIALGVGSFRMEGYWVNYWKVFDNSGRIILIALSLCIASLFMPWSYDWDGGEYIMGYAAPALIQGLLFLYPCINLFQEKISDKSLSYICAALSLAFTGGYFLNAKNSHYSSSLDVYLDGTEYGILVAIISSLLLLIGIYLQHSQPKSTYKFPGQKKKLK